MRGLDLLIVEDEANLGQTLQEYLSSKGHQVRWATSYRNAQLEIESQLPDVALFDIGLPDGDGRDLAKELRSISPTTVFLFLSALNDPETRLEGLEIGADDYITKPFELKELDLRLKRILKLKGPHQESNYFQFGKLKIWFKKFEVQDGQGRVMGLSFKECALLKLLMTNKGQVVDRDTMIDSIWGIDAYPSNRTIDNYIVKLRQWADSDPQAGLKITTVRGVGYKLEIIP